MKITLLRPTFGTRFAIAPPLTLGYLATALRAKNFNDISLLDGSFYMLTPAHAVEILKEKHQPELLGIQVYTGSHEWTRDFIRIARTELPKVTVLVGGPHITALQELAMEYLGADYGIIGEGEYGIGKFAEWISGSGAAKDPSDVDGLLYKKNGVWTNAKVKFGFLEDANTFPMPDWELLEPTKYFQYMEGATMALKGKRPAAVLTSRGCPYLCTFCSSGLTNKRVMRYRTPRAIVDEIKYLIKTFGVDEIGFQDDNLTMDLKRAETIFDLMLEEKIKVHWKAPNGIRIDRLSEPLVAKMSRTGCYYVGVGVETGNPEVMKRIKKHLDLTKVNATLRLLHKYRIQVSGFFMCGMLQETEAEMKDTETFALKNPFDRIQVSNYIPYPGSEDFEVIFKKSEPEVYKKNVMAFQNDMTVPKFTNLELDDIIKHQKRFLLRFYFRPRIILSFLKSLRFSQIKAIFNHPWITRWFKKDRKWYD
jgi:anaerobic magnesium-protoporphyrin IX monomethyl ester cyclase